ncbi:glycosyltransferase [Lacrimispora sp. 38-1]|uniref:glycosyltransferase n=1 Tax=Lacrimispora sp. 38-1 TaxID=3125778 RepID=UPI003CF50A9D
MIFATVGTHEQPFNRLLEEIDRLKKTGIILEDVIIQTGYSTYEPRYCEWHKLLPYDDMVKNVEHARIVITHGGPASFIMPLQIGKIPVVVPRQYEFHEHVNNHQVEFTKAVKERYGNIIPVYQISKLADVIVRYDSIISSIPAGIMSNNGAFNKQMELLVKGLFRNDQETDRWQK